MRIGVGSGNPVKRAATERALKRTDAAFAADAVIEHEPVASGVSEQPRGHTETRTGAVTRAHRVLAAGYDLGVGIEGGVTDAYGPVTPADAESVTPERGHLSLIMWAAVTNGDRTSLGGGPTFPLPQSIGDRVRAGEELGPVMDDVLGQEGVARDQGAAGAVTGGGIDRTDALAAAVAGAFGPFVTELYD